MFAENVTDASKPYPPRNDAFNLLFLYGLLLSFQKNILHRIFNLFGAAFNLTTAFTLLYVKYLGGGLENAGIIPVVKRWIIDTHRIFAILALILMLLMVWSGITRKKEFHRKLHYIFLPLYTAIFLSGLVLFRSTN
ncbi:PF04238 family protein [Leptospira borgpetersenii str. Noumea 25]|nr:PF04238 family protein [Leptospira borgpetersenii str. Noumea 25]